jgi:hypothetical protein
MTHRCWWCRFEWRDEHTDGCEVCPQCGTCLLVARNGKTEQAKQTEPAIIVCGISSPATEK